MIRYRNTDNGVVLNVPDFMAPRYDRACNMERVDPPAEEVLDLAKLKVDELRAYAKEHGIVLEGTTRKADILAAIASRQSPVVDRDVDEEPEDAAEGSDQESEDSEPPDEDE